MRYTPDHDRTKNSFPAEGVSQEQFLAVYSAASSWQRAAMSPSAREQPVAVSGEVNGILVACYGDKTIPLVDIVERVDIGLIDNLARLHLAARRFDLTVQVRDACPNLKELLELAGLTNLLARRDDSSNSTRSDETAGGDER